MPIAALLVAAALQAAPPPAGPSAPPPSAEALGLAKRLSGEGLLGAVAAPVTEAQVLDVIASHPGLPADLNGKVVDVAYAARVDAVNRLAAAEAEMLATSLTPDQMRGALAFFESPAGQAYRSLFPLILVKLGQTEPGKDFKSYVERRVCAETQVCPGGKRPAP